MPHDKRGFITTADVIVASSTDLTAKTAPIGADSGIIIDSQASSVVKKATFANIAKAISPTLAGVEATNGLTQASGVLTVAAKVDHVEAAMRMGVVTVPMSFETGEQGATKVYFPFACTITKLYGIVTKALSANDAGTIQGATVAGSGGASSLLTFPLSSVLGAEVNASPAVNATVLKDGYYSLTSQKTTVAGKVFVTITYIKTTTV